MIPVKKSAAVARGLREAFGVTEFDEIDLLTKGQTSALVFRIVVGGAPYLLRIIMRSDDPTRHFACMRAAAQAGLAPHVWYTSVEDRLSITDFVEAVPFAVEEALVKMAATLRAVHALPPFGGVEKHLNTTCTFLLHEGPALKGLLEKFGAVETLTVDERDELLARYAEVAVVYPRDGSEMVSSHNDLFKPDNVLFDGERVWLVDWEAAFLNDRYVDLAVVANHVVTNEAEEREYLLAYFGQAPDEYQRARFFLMRQLVHVFYAMAFLYLGASGGHGALKEPLPGFDEFRRRFWNGEVRLEDNPTKVLYGRIHLERVLQNTQEARFHDALRIVAERSGRG